MTSNHIPYKGVGPMLTDIMGGQVDWGVLGAAVGAGPSQGRHAAGDRRRHARSASRLRRRSRPWPNRDVPNYLVDGWFAVIGPAKLPPARSSALHAGVDAALATPEVQDAMAKQGNVISPTTPEAAVAFFKSEQDKVCEAGGEGRRQTRLG